MPEEQHRPRKILVWTLLIPILCGLAGAGYYWYLQWDRPPEYSDERPVLAVLLEENASFKEADRLMRARDFPAALEQYKKALPLAKDDFQRVYIEYWIADTYENLRNFPEAIRRYKQVAAIAPYSLLKAYSLLRIALIYDWYAYGSERDAIIAETFSDPPLAYLLEPDLKISYRNVYEEAASTYPLAVAEMRSADWYADEMLRMLEAGESNIEVQGYYDLIMEKVARANADMEKTSQYESATHFIPIALEAMGEVVAKVAVAAEHPDAPFAEQAKSDGMTLSAAESLFLETLELRALRGGRDSYERFYYAAFLARYFEGRDEEIKMVLSNYFEIPEYKDSPVMELFRTIRGSDNWKAASVIKLANIDPRFRELLISLGWTESDFL